MERKEFMLYSQGLVFASVCTSLSDEEATERMNQENPTGLESKWEIAEDKTFANGEPHPLPCPDSKSHRHLLFNC